MNIRNPTAGLAALLTLVSTGCDPNEPQIEAEAVSNIVAYDIGDSNSEQDMEVAFSIPSDEATVGEYRIIVVKESNAATFDAEAAGALRAPSLTVAKRANKDISAVLDMAATDSDGDLIANDIAYLVFVLTVADGDDANVNTLASAAVAITLKDVALEITYLQNDGVLISDGENRVLVDALINLGTNSGWVSLGSSEQAKLVNARAPYNRVDVVLATHNHGDHHSPTTLLTYLAANSGAKFLAPPQITNGLASSSQIVRKSITKFTRATETINGIRVDIFHLRHFDAFGNDFSGVENYGYLLYLDGYKVLHLGDVDMSSENFDALGLETENIDVVLIPTFVQSVHLGASQKAVMATRIDPQTIIGLHLLSGSIESLKSQISAAYPSAIIFSTPLEKFSL